MQFFFQTKRVTGQRALLGAWSLWFLLFLIMPVSTVFHGTLESITLFVLANGAVFLGLSGWPFSNHYSRLPAEHFSYNERHVQWILLFLVACGVLAIAAKSADLINYRDILSARSFAEGRERMAANGSNLFSGIYYGLSPTIVAGGILALAVLRTARHRLIAVAALALFCINPVFSFVYGGRSILFMTAGMAIISWLLLVPKLSRRHLLCILGLLTLVFFVSMYLYVSRVVETAGVRVDILAGKSDYTKLVPLKADTIATMRDLPVLGRYLLYYVTSVGQYILHGVFEFFYLVQAESPDQRLLWGRYEFTLYDQTLRAFLGPGSVPNLETYNPTTGLFSTFWGPAYIDFGYLMIVYGFVFGYVTRLVRGLMERGDLFALPLYVLLILQIFLVPVVNGVLTASAVILNVGLFGIWLLARFFLGRQGAGIQVAE